jgi:hypothetical protein
MSYRDPSAGEGTDRSRANLCLPPAGTSPWYCEASEPQGSLQPKFRWLLFFETNTFAFLATFRMGTAAPKAKLSSLNSGTVPGGRGLILFWGDLADSASGPSGVEHLV